MPEPTGPRRLRPQRLARQLLDEELRASTRARQQEFAAPPAWGPLPRAAVQHSGPPPAPGSAGQATDDVADELLRVLRDIWLRVLRYRPGPAPAAGGGEHHFEQPPPTRSQEDYQAPWAEARQSPDLQGYQWNPEPPGRQQSLAAPGSAQAPGFPQAPGFAQGRGPAGAPPFAQPPPGFAPQGPGYPMPPPGQGFAPPPQQRDGQRRLMKEQPADGAVSALEQYGKLRPEQQAAVRAEVSKLIDGKTRYQVAASRNLLPFNVSLAQAARSYAKSTEAPPSERSWLSRLTARKPAQQGGTRARTAEEGAPAVPGARMAAPPRLPQLPHYAGQTPVAPSRAPLPQAAPGPRTDNAATRAVSRAVAPDRADTAVRRTGPPVPPKLPVPPPKLPLDAPDTAPGRARNSSPAGSPGTRPVSPAQSSADPTVRTPVSPTVSPVSRTVSPSFSPVVANQSLEHHLPGGEARGTGTPAPSPPSPYRAPAVQQTGTPKRGPSRSR
ncbi:hypothetical protein [Streptomyces qinglanensis]|uniref:Uncharacterized protein n=1 Tax=Streptomyces qinglanensis TaxID=943816 RepID=A0A1H9SB97_9ACTN|nr:hypothetical protein [Streptomyces qinglanensis]SER82282.1 hypothetical protein SAMN05421870_104416 [Streptomyces qinglanensis]